MIIASGENFTDALSAVPLAKKYNAPIILTPKNSLNDDVKKELLRLRVKETIIIGGTGVISENIESTIISMNIRCIRLWGQDRFETGIKIAEKLDNFNSIVIANSESFADALSIAPIAAKNSMPILLTTNNNLPDVIKNYLKNKNITNSYLIGGTSVISDLVKKEFPNPLRIYGKNRYETNIEILKNFSKDLDLNKVYTASGENFPDALCGAALAACESAPIVLSNKNPDEATYTFLTENFNKDNTQKIVLGGEEVIPSSSFQNSFKREIYGNSYGNLMNLGTAVCYKGCTYKSLLTNDHYSLYKIFLDGKTKIKIVDSDPLLMNIKDDWIYYVDSNNTDGIYKITTNGTNKTKISHDFPNSMQIVGDWIYYSMNFYQYASNPTNTGLYKVKLDGTDNTKISNHPSGFINIAGDYVYVNYSSYGQTYKLPKDTKVKFTNNPNVVKVSNSKELLENIAPNTKLILKSGDYNLLEPKIIDNIYLEYKKVFDGYEIWLNSLWNFSIETEVGADVNLLINPRYSYVLNFERCNNINISCIVAGHYTKKGHCTGGVFKFLDCNDIKINSSDLFGCGTEGLTLDNVNNLQFENSTIRDCSYGIMTVDNSKNITFSNSTFKDNIQFNMIVIKYSDVNFNKCTMSGNKTFSKYFPYLFYVDNNSNLSISNSTIENNKIPYLINSNYEKVNFKNMIFRGDNFD